MSKIKKIELEINGEYSDSIAVSEADYDLGMHGFRAALLVDITNGTVGTWYAYGNSYPSSVHDGSAVLVGNILALPEYELAEVVSSNQGLINRILAGEKAALNDLAMVIDELRQAVYEARHC